MTTALGASSNFNTDSGLVATTTPLDEIYDRFAIPTHTRTLLRDGGHICLADFHRFWPTKGHARLSAATDLEFSPSDTGYTAREPIRLSIRIAQTWEATGLQHRARPDHPLTTPAPS